MVSSQQDPSVSQARWSEPNAEPMELIDLTGSGSNRLSIDKNPSSTKNLSKRRHDVEDDVIKNDFYPDAFEKPCTEDDSSIELGLVKKRRLDTPNFQLPVSADQAMQLQQLSPDTTTPATQAFVVEQTSTLVSEKALLNTDRPVKSESAVNRDPTSQASATIKLSDSISGGATVPGAGQLEELVHYLFANPLIVQENLLLLEGKVQANRDSFRNTLIEGQLNKQAGLKEEKRLLHSQQTALLAVLAQNERYSTLLLQNNALIEQALEAFDQGLASDELERQTNDVVERLLEQETSLISRFDDVAIRTLTPPLGSQTRKVIAQPGLDFQVAILGSEDELRAKSESSSNG